MRGQLLFWILGSPTCEHRKTSSTNCRFSQIWILVKAEVYLLMFVCKFGNFSMHYYYNLIIKKIYDWTAGDLQSNILKQTLRLCQINQ